MAARAELGSEYESAVIEGFLDKIEHEIDRRVDERMAAQRQAAQPGWASGLPYFSVFFGVGGTIALVEKPGGLAAAIIMLIALTVINVVAVRRR